MNTNQPLTGSVSRNPSAHLPRANATPARPVLPADFGAWKVTHSGIFNKVAQYEIPAESLWDGPLSGGPFHDSWEHHLRHKQWMRPGDYADLIAALSYARRAHVAKQPARVSMQAAQEGRK